MLSLIAAIIVLFSTAAEDAARDRAVATARAALVAQQGLKPEQVEIADAIPREWPDASLGCPQPGELYAQVVTPGYRVLLRVGKKLHVVHVAEPSAVVCGQALAAAPVQPEPAPDPPELFAPEPESAAQKELVRQAREDLARRLSLSPDDVRLVKFKEVVWPDRGFGCPRAGVVHPQVPQDGALIVLQAGGRRFDYHSGAGHKPFLCSSPKTKG